MYDFLDFEIIKYCMKDTILCNLNAPTYYKLKQFGIAKRIRRGFREVTTAMFHLEVLMKGDEFLKSHTVK